MEWQQMAAINAINVGARHAVPPHCAPTIVSLPLCPYIVPTLCPQHIVLPLSCPYIVPILCPHIVPPHCASTLCLTIVSPQCVHIVLPYYALDCASTTVLPPSCGFPEFGGRNLRAEHGMTWVAADSSSSMGWQGQGMWWVMAW